MIVAVFGGSFNPPHVSHVLACTLVLATEPVDRVLVVPTFRHPFAKALAPYDDRVAMCERAMGWLPRVEVSRLEAQLGGESKTLFTLEHLQKTHPDWVLRLVVGTDILSEAPRWFGFDRIQQIAPLIVLGRRGHERDGAPTPLLPEISSSAVRAAFAAGRLDDVRSLVPRDVVAYVASHGLYAP